MPNWCDNILVVEGEDRRVDEFLEACKDTYINWGDEEDFKGEMLEFSFSGIYPPPTEVVEAGFDKKGYDWCISSWGTKWQPSDSTVQRYEGKAFISFSSAWSPPTGWLVKASEEFSELSFELKYYEGGCCFAGCMVCEDGMLIENLEVDSSWEAVRRFAENEMGYEFEEDEELLSTTPPKS